ncbi:hypothetical protein RBU49_03035 [Clostridium sp. MB40-C1]|uniref:hypothetical protein n=1 Tax=Clostridium sp. MB40-C1 TaxID=3070996 RepID=UPI0027E02EAE|nr:hypothetical protein [Clostridium sp. MB40-C1]WMJ81245.1 hypothetical protein RBU49_03035 [Clostridium sp. MB40-C1]
MMKFNKYSRELKNIENMFNSVNKIKNDCSENGNLEDFINTINTFNNMANDDITYFCSRDGRVYIEKPGRFEFGREQISYNNVIAYGIEEDKLVLYTSYSSLEKMVCTIDGEYEFPNKRK